MVNDPTWQIDPDTLMSSSVYSLSASHWLALQSQKVVSAYLESKQILPFGFARQDSRDGADR